MATGGSAPDFSEETRLRRMGPWPVAGVDEAGRGPLAGPVSAAAVILNPRDVPAGLNDSKLLQPGIRERLFEEILTRAVAVSFAFIAAAEIDATDIRRAALLAMARAVRGLAIPPAYALVDGRDLPDLPCPGAALVRGDGRSLSIAAASIIAKVARDRAMRALDEAYPAYGFGTNAGYGVKRHLEALETFGPTPHHRLSFSPCRREDHGD
ncbi:MAG TPA: ribonuclease HII [Methylocystis sp.]|nr:ribonuclease HII [Methylocystis sp.]